MSATKLNYLTVQDMIWINLQVTQHVNPFDYAYLEEATFYQYGYGSSTELCDQAGRFLAGFASKAPFSEGDEATAFIGFLGFLSINGRRCTLNDSDALAWLRSHAKPSAADIEAITEATGHGPIFEKTGEHGEPDIRATLGDALERYRETVAQLVPASAV
jgi:prophage maintenance system killer protein